MSIASYSFDRRVDRLRDALAFPVTWPRGRKVPSVGNHASLKPSHWRGERARRGPVSGSSSRHMGTQQIRRKGVASRRTVGRPTSTGETSGTHQRDRRRLSIVSRGIPASVKSMGRGRNDCTDTDNGLCGGETERINRPGRNQTEQRGQRRRLLTRRGMCGPWL